MSRRHLGKVAVAVFDAGERGAGEEHGFGAVDVRSAPIAELLVQKHHVVDPSPWVERVRHGWVRIDSSRSEGWSCRGAIAGSARVPR